MNLTRHVYLSFAFAALLSGCGSGGAADEPVTGEPVQRTESPALPVSEPTGEIDEELAEAGEELFEAKGCIACHTIGKGRLTGPDLASVTTRRDFEWIYYQIMRPDSMTIHDPTAKELMAEYMTQMPNLALEPEAAKALYEYLREQDEESSEEEAE